VGYSLVVEEKICESFEGRLNAAICEILKGRLEATICEILEGRLKVVIVTFNHHQRAK
jgi:hypothetical protein